MKNVHKIVIPGILIALLGGVTMFFLAYSYYPQKHANVTLDGKCYELLGNAYNKYKNLDMEREKEIKILQVQAIGDPNAIVPIVFSGTKNDINEFILQNHINVVASQSLGINNPDIDKTIVTGNILNKNLFKIIESYPNTNTEYFTKTVSYSVGIQPTPDISSEESQYISKSIEQMVHNGISEIINEKDGIKLAECRG